jgi:hypothetical protein
MENDIEGGLSIASEILNHLAGKGISSLALASRPAFSYNRLTQRRVLVLRGSHERLGSQRVSAIFQRQEVAPTPFSWGMRAWPNTFH